MAKLNYSKPLFGICPIPLDLSGPGGGRAIRNNSADYVCPVTDPELNETFFTESKNGCLRIPAASDLNDAACYHVPWEDLNVYSS